MSNTLQRTIYIFLTFIFERLIPFNMKYKFIIIAAIIEGIFLSGCGKAVINTPSDEIKLYTWEYTGSEGLKSTIRFDGDEAVIRISNFDDSCVIKGLCIFEGDTMEIIGDMPKGELKFNYELTGKSLTLHRADGLSVEFLKKEK